jgi:HopJ type III effector protein
MALIDAHYDYFAVPFSVGDVKSKANENTGSAKIFSFALMTKMDVDTTLKMFGEHYRNLKPDGTDHPNIRSFKKLGWAGVTFPSGLAIASKLQAYEDTDTAFATQSSIEGEAGWDADSDSWIP